MARLSTLIHLLPAHKFGVTTFSNMSSSGGSNPLASIIAMRLTDDLLGVPHAERVDFVKDAQEEADKDAERKTHNNFADKAKELFPDTKSEGLGMPLKEDPGVPLSSCAGRYSCPGYGAIEVHVSTLDEVRSKRRHGHSSLVLGKSDGDTKLQDVLFIDMTDRSYPAELVLVRHNAKRFVVEWWSKLECLVID